jgi:hypothetical protein
MNKTPAKRSYNVHSQIEADGVTYPAGSQAELTEEQAASVGDCVTPAAPAPAASAPVVKASKSE